MVVALDRKQWGWQLGSGAQEPAAVQSADWGVQVVPRSAAAPTAVLQVQRQEGGPAVQAVLAPPHAALGALVPGWAVGFEGCSLQSAPILLVQQKPTWQGLIWLHW